MKLTYKDNQLTTFAKCNLLDEEAAEPEFIAASRTIKSILLAAVDKKPITKQNITSKFEEEYKTFFPTLIKDKKYWDGIKAGRRFISKFYWILTKYEVLQPIQTYTLVISGITIEGEYALIQKKTETEKPLVLNLNYNRPLFYLYPDLGSCAKWMHSKTNYLDTGIYNFSMFRGDDWKYKELQEPLINKWLYAILKQINNIDFQHVSRGSHCLSCKTKRCLEVFNVR